MKRAWLVTLGALVSVGCASEAVLLPASPELNVEIAAGNPPPPRVFGKLTASFNLVDASGARTATTYSFPSAAGYNRNLTNGKHLLEVGSGGAFIKADTNGVIQAQGVVTAVNNATGAVLTVDFSQLSGFTGPLFVACPAGSPVNCVLLSANFTGTITFPGGKVVGATGTFRFRWETN